MDQIPNVAPFQRPFPAVQSYIVAINRIEDGAAEADSIKTAFQTNGTRSLALKDKAVVDNNFDSYIPGAMPAYTIYHLEGIPEADATCNGL
jgi:hypothetical protein